MRRSFIFVLFLLTLISAALPLTALGADDNLVQTCPHTSGRYYLPNVALSLRDGELLLVDLATQMTRTLEAETETGSELSWGKSCRYIFNRSSETGHIIALYDVMNTNSPLMIVSR